jgi:MerR family transcriptional regulator, thiopeptide resistance regulator
MKRGLTYRINEVAVLAGVSVRTLHHYDAIGLLMPTGRTGSGYRLYDEAAFLRLQQILIGRELGLSLEEIRRSLDDPNFDLRSALLEQRKQLVRRAGEVARMLRAIDRALDMTRLGERQDLTMSDNDIKEIFDGFDPSEHEAEAKQRWGNTDEYKESKKRTSSYTKDDWEKLGAEQGAIYNDAVAAMKAGESPDGDVARDIAERHRLSIERWFYPCAHAMHRGLADMYEADQRFAQNIDKYGEGLTPFLSAAIRANAARHGA